MGSNSLEKAGVDEDAYQLHRCKRVKISLA